MPNFDSFSMDAFRLDGKVAVITGANTGLGMGYAVAYAKAGADIFIPHLIEDVSEVKALVEKEGRKVVFYQGDLTDHEYLNSIVPKCVEAFGRLDILVNNAGMNHFAPFDEYPDNRYAKVVEVNLNSCYYLARQVGLYLKAHGGGKIINIASALSFTADYNCPPYVVAKHGIIGLTRLLANELGAYNVQSNAIAPGFIATEVNAGQREGTDLYKKVVDRTPAGRWGDVTDLMGTAVFLASHASDYINGWAISVDGGFTCKI